MSVSPYVGAATQVRTGGVAEVAIYGPVSSGFLYNPPAVRDQGISLVEPLFVDITGRDAVLSATQTCQAIIPGQRYYLPANLQNNVSVNAATSGHRFSAVAIQPPTQYPPTPPTSSFPPTGPVTKLTTIPSYLYWQYTDDDDLLAFVAAQNQYTQIFVDWFNSINLPIYTQPQIYGALLDWVAGGIYGYTRPVLSSGRPAEYGEFNTYEFNTLEYNSIQVIGPRNVTATTDDVYKRLLTWHFYKGDGKQHTVTWLKRRIARFLYGVNGTDYSQPQYNISVSFGVGGQVNITLITTQRAVVQDTTFDSHNFFFNAFEFNECDTIVRNWAPPALASIFQEAIETGAIESPFQVTAIVTI